MKKMSPFVSIIIWLTVVVIFFAAALSALQTIIYNNNERIVLDTLTNDDDKMPFKYQILTTDQNCTSTFSMHIPKTEFDRIGNRNEPYKLVIYRLACNWYKVYFNNQLIGSFGNTSSDNSIIWNGIAGFDIAPESLSDDNIITIEIYGQYEIGCLSFLPFITDMNEGCRIIGWLHFLTGFYTMAIGILLLCFLLLLLLSTMLEQKNLAYLCYAIATILSAFYICDSLTIQYLFISLLTFKKLIYTAVYCSIATFSLAIHFHFRRMSPLICGLILYGLTFLLDIMSTNTIVIRQLALICNISILVNVICWIYITMTEEHKHAEAKILCAASIFLLGTAMYDIIFMFLKTNSTLNLLCANIFGALFLSVAIAVMIFGEYITLNGKVIREKERGKKLYDKSVRDTMTGVFNKGYLMTCLKNQDDMYSIIMIDADKFKSINDTYGHDSGDEVIIRIANICTQNVREDDIVCREGGDEFVIILPLCNEETGTAIATDILNAFREPFTLQNGQTLNMTLSMGVYCNPTGTIDYITALRYADQAQYAVKQNGRNNVLSYTQAVGKGLIPREMIEVKPTHTLKVEKIDEWEEFD